MDKAAFLKELQQHIEILNESEQKDILDEYAQHIDMKMGKGMSESEAIRDFGNLDELTAEILEAYHVNPQFGTKKRTKFIRKEDIPVEELKETGKKFWTSGACVMKKAGAGICSFLKAVGHTLAKPFVLAAAAFTSWKLNREESRQDIIVSKEAITLPQKRKTVTSILRGTMKGVKRLMKLCFYAIATCCRWIWNLCMMFIVLMTGLMTFAGIFCFGILTVLLFQGYPVVGFVIGTFGLVLCGGAVTILVFSLIRGKKTPEKYTEEQLPQQETIIQEVPEHA